MPEIPTSYVANIVRMARSRFLYGLDQVPEEQLTVAPGGAHSPLIVADRFSAFLERLRIGLTQGISIPLKDLLPPPATSRAEAKARVEAGFEAVLAVLDSLTDADLERPYTAPWGKTLPTGQMLIFLAGTLGYFQGQLNYVQLTYGDADPNIPPEWRQ